MDQQATQLAELVTSAFTALGVLLLLLQIHLSRRQSQTAFEDQMAREFRDIVHKLPARVVLGALLAEAEHDEVFDDIYRYLDLTNEQVFLRSTGRISKGTWEYWAEGIREILTLPEFSRVWNRVKSDSKSRFRELRRLESGEFLIDPRSW
jgi:hypothetical protein